MSPRHLSVLAAAIVILGGAVAIANPTGWLSKSIAQAPAGPRHDRGPNRGQDGWLRELNLTADQMQKIQAIRSQYRDQIAQQRRELRQAQQELRDLMAGDASADTVRQKYRQVATIKQKLGDTQFESMLAMREQLKPEQRRAFADRMKKQREGFKNRRMERQPQPSQS